MCTYFAEKFKGLIAKRIFEIADKTAKNYFMKRVI